MAPHRYARAEARSVATVRQFGGEVSSIDRHWQESKVEHRRQIGRAGVVVQRDADVASRRGRCIAVTQGVIFTDLGTAREHPELVQKYFMTQAVPVASASSKRCTPRSGRAARSSTCRKRCVELPFRSFASRVSRRGTLHSHSCHPRGGRRGILCRCIPLRASAIAVIRLGGGRTDRRAKAASCATSRCRTGGATSGTS